MLKDFNRDLQHLHSGSRKLASWIRPSFPRRPSGECLAEPPGALQTPRQRTTARLCTPHLSAQWCAHDPTNRAVTSACVSPRWLRAARRVPGGPDGRSGCRVPMRRAASPASTGVADSRSSSRSGPCRSEGATDASKRGSNVCSHEILDQSTRPAAEVPESTQVRAWGAPRPRLERGTYRLGGGDATSRCYRAEPMRQRVPSLRDATRRCL